MLSVDVVRQTVIVAEVGQNVKLIKNTTNSAATDSLHRPVDAQVDTFVSVKGRLEDTYRDRFVVCTNDQLKYSLTINAVQLNDAGKLSFLERCSNEPTITSSELIVLGRLTIFSYFHKNLHEISQ